MERKSKDEGRSGKKRLKRWILSNCVKRKMFIVEKKPKGFPDPEKGIYVSWLGRSQGPYTDLIVCSPVLSTFVSSFVPGRGQEAKNGCGGYARF